MESVGENSGDIEESAPPSGAAPAEDPAADPEPEATPAPVEEQATPAPVEEQAEAPPEEAELELAVIEEPEAEMVMEEPSHETEAEIVEAAEVQEEMAVEPAANAPRLMIKQIVLENFKSYGGRKVIGPFHKNFSSIVGPNGSGKSNTIDALLFVFGKRAKKMRLNKVSELIHASGTLRDCASAKVEVTFQDIIDTGEGPDDYEVVPNSTLTVCREAFKNNQSKYWVDGSASNFTDVTQLLRQRGVDLEHNRFLILQGEVEQISLMKPKALTPHEDGLLEYLEDIIGSNKYVEPIQQAEEVVEKLTEQRQEKLNRLRVAEREKDALDGPRKEAEAWVCTEAERLELGSLLAQAEVTRSQKSLGKMEEEHKVLQANMAEHRKKMEGFEKQVKAIEDEHNKEFKIYKQTQVEMEKAAAAFKEFERLDVKFTEDIAFHEQKSVKLKQTEQAETERSVKLVQDAERLREEAPAREKELEGAEKYRTQCVAKLEKLNEGLKSKAEKLRPQKEKKEAELVPLRKKLSAVKQEVEMAQAEANMLGQKIQQVQEQIDTAKRESEDCSHRLKVRETENKEAAKQCKERSKLIGDAQSRLETIVQQIEQVGQEVNAARVKAEEAKSEFEQEHYRGQLIKAVYDESKAGRLRGVFGRLGDLGTIDKKYDIAVSTACGMLDALVVESTEDAQAVIEFVRQRNLGRTTCICLQKIQEKAREMDRGSQTPEGAPRLIDLIKPTEERFKVAFFFALKDTLVAKNLEQATRIGLQGGRRWRVVTLDGGLIDVSGTMSGGGGKPSSGGMRASLCRYSPEQVKQFVEAYNQAAARFAGLRQDRQQLEEAVRITEKELAEWEVRGQKCTMDIASLKKQLEAYDARLKALKIPTLSNAEKTKIKQLEATIEGRAGELRDLQEKHQAVEEEVRRLHEQIMNIGGEELKQAKSNVDESTRRVDELKHANKKAFLDADNMVKNAKKSEQAAKSAAEEYAKNDQILANLRKEHAALDEKAAEVIAVYNKHRQDLTEKEKTLAEYKKKNDAVLQQAAAVKSQQVDLVNEIEEKTRALREHISRMTTWGNKLVEFRAEYKQLPLDLLQELRTAAEKAGHVKEFTQEMSQRAIAVQLAEEELAKVHRAEVEAKLETLEAHAKNLKPNLASIQEFRRADAEHRNRLSDYETVHNQREEARSNLEHLRQSRLEDFMNGFKVISMKLKEMYQMITLGGDAELELVDMLDPFSEGINFSVRPPKKSWKQITNLSGGEKTLASLSLVFALHHYKPTPLYFMDEIDAALDFRNVSIIANYIKERTKNAQFIVISLRNHMFEMADLLVGIYKTSDISKSVAILPSGLKVTRPPIKDTESLAAKRHALVPIEAPPLMPNAKRRKVSHKGKENRP